VRNTPVHARTEHVDGTHDVGAKVHVRLAERKADARLAGDVEDEVERVVREDVVHDGAISDVALDERGGGRDSFAEARRQVVEDGHVESVDEQTVDQVGADEPGAASDEHPPHEWLPARSANISSSGTVTSQPG
jgi:hypothetical protein